MKIDEKKLQKLIDASVRGNNRAIDAEEKLNDFCEEMFGFIPGDRDVDSIIDAVFGGCGQSSGMSAEEFIKLMEEAK